MSNEHSPTLAVIYSVLLPGLGQLYNQEALKGIIFFCCLVFICFVYSPLGILVHIFAPIEAFLKARRLRETGFISRYKKTAVYILIAFFIVGFLAGFFGGLISTVLK